MAKEYIERDAAVSAVRHAWAKGLEPTQYIEEIPAADVVEVVRCKDCHLSCYVQGTIGEALYCTYWNKDTDEEGYCQEGW